MLKIDSFRKEHLFLSNFYNHPFEYDGLTYPNSEAAFQAQKCQDPEGKIKYTLVKNPLSAKQMGKREKLPDNWNEISGDIMLSVLRAKFVDPRLAEKLIATGDALLEEGNHWHDNLWGNCSCEKCRDKAGENRLGKILMRIREEIKAGG